MKNPPYEHEQAVAIRAVREAARLCRAVATRISPDVLAKKDKSPVTVADFGSQALICHALAESFPDDPVIAEEDSNELTQPENATILEQVLRQVCAIQQDDISDEQVCSWIDRGGNCTFSDRFWTIDPIDGTKGFLRGEQYAVALALVVDGHVAVAALACPNLSADAASEQAADARGAIFWAVKGHGAYVVSDEGSGETTRVPVRLSVSVRDDPATVRFCESVESGHSAQGDSAIAASRLGITAPPLRMDSQAKYAVVARGEADIYLRLPTRADYREKIWDHAAGALIIAEAGGTITDINGRPLEFNHGRELAVNRGVVVTNGRLHERVIEAVRSLGKQPE